MIWTIKVKLGTCRYDSSSWQATFEMESSTTLEEVHFAIQDAVDFDNDHLYEFFVTRTERSRDRVVYDDENEGLYAETLESVFPLKKGYKLFYLFDYGDNWVFQVSVSRKAPFTADPNEQYPQLVAQKGEKPEQYPDYED